MGLRGEEGFREVRREGRVGLRGEEWGSVR